MECRRSIISFLKSRYVHEVSLTESETAAEPAILEGTGSMVLDRVLFDRVCRIMMTWFDRFGVCVTWRCRSAQIWEWLVSGPR